MKDRIQNMLAEVAAAELPSPEAVEAFRIKFLGRKGKIKDLMADFKAVPGAEKRELGPMLNQLKQAVEQKVVEAQQENVVRPEASGEDATRPSGGVPMGTHHPLPVVRREIVGIFQNMGFAVAEGPEIEDDWHVFSGLNFPPEHPARDMQDTFFVERDPDMVLRTHTSSVQVREMEKREPPMRLIMPGRVFRNEAISARAHCMFHQIEGLYIDKDVSFADLKQTLLHFARCFFGPETDIRLRPSYFPFTEPSAEVDVYWAQNRSGQAHHQGHGLARDFGLWDGGSQRVEGERIDPEVYSGFAFGMGIERITMLRYQIGDLRHFFENDRRFLDQFVGER